MAEKKRIDMDTEELLSKLTVEEKASLVCGATFFGLNGADRFNVPSLMTLDGGTGINFEQLFGDFCSKEQIQTNSTNGMMGMSALSEVIENYYHPDRISDDAKKLYEWISERLTALTGGEYAPACYPPGILLGATFDPEMVFNTGVALGKEAQLFGIDILLGTPNVNIHRDPLNGRLFEGYSEDPCLVSTLAPNLVKGVQQEGVAANVKHFAANNQETNRVGINETISARALQEVYLPGFKACVQEGEVKTVMSAYNAINGTPCSENRWLLTDTLRDEWGFDGVVVSDWGAVYHPVEALQAGNDLAMPGPISPQPLLDAIADGRLSEETLDIAAGRMLKLIDFCRSKANGIEKIDFAALRALTDKAAYDAAASGIIMLKNQGLLYPLADSGEPVVITGSGAEELLPCGSGSAGITTDRTSELAQTLRSGLKKSPVCVAAADDLLDFKPETGTRFVFVVKAGGMEGNDRPDMLLPQSDRKALRALCAMKQRVDISVTLVLNTCGPVDFSEFEGFIDGVFVCFLPGMEGAHALGDIMLGKRCPSGKLPLSWPKRYEDTPTYLNFPGEGKEVNYGEGIYVGYRYYDKKKIRPAYPFGFGMSYTSFKISDLTVNSQEFDGELHGSVTVTNTGGVKGAEVVQIYVSDPVSALPKPVKELKFFAKVELEPSESRKVEFILREKDFASYDPQYGMWLTEEGDYDIIAASSSAPEDEAQRVRVYLRADNVYSYGLHTTVKVLCEHPQLRTMVDRLWAANGWDIQIVESNYQYTNSRILREIFPDEPTEESVEMFLAEVSGVRH